MSQHNIPQIFPKFKMRIDLYSKQIKNQGILETVHLMQYWHPQDDGSSRFIFLYIKYQKKIDLPVSLWH